jgi:hypothetical protein
MCATIAEMMIGNWKFLIFFQSSRERTLWKINRPKPNSNLTAYSYDKSTHAISILYMHTNKKLESGNWKFLFFSKFKRDNSVKNQWTITKFEHDLRIPIMYLHIQFQPYTYMYTNKSYRAETEFFFQER